MRQAIPSASFRHWTKSANLELSLLEHQPRRLNMRLNKSLIGLTAIVISSMLALPAQAKTSNTNDPKTVAAITQLENDAVKADLAGDASFYEKNLADNWSGGDSNGTWYTKQELIANMKDTDKNKMDS